MTASTSERIERSADSCANTLARSSCGWTGRRPPASSANCSANGTVGPIGLRFVVLRPFVLPDGAGLGLRLLRLGLKPRLRSDLVAAALEDLEGHLELLRLKGPQVQFLRQVDEVPFFLRQVEDLPDQFVVVPFRRWLEGSVPDPVDVAPDRPRLLQVDMRQDRAHVREPQRVQRAGVSHMLQDGGPYCFELAEVLG